MWNPFKRRHPSLKQLATIPDEWKVMTGRHEGEPIVVRVHGAAGKWAGHPELPLRLGFAIPLNEPNPEGLPSLSEAKQLDAIEDRIITKAHNELTCLHVLTITTGTMREVVFYITETDGGNIEPVHLSLDGQVESHEVQCAAQVDGKWDVYKYFASQNIK